MWGDHTRLRACGDGGDRHALGWCSGANPMEQTTLDMPRTHLSDGDIPGARREGVRAPGKSGDAGDPLGDPTVALRGSHYLGAGPPVRNQAEHREVPYQAVPASRI